MLSDTLFDAKHDIIGGLLNYEPDNYGITGTQIEDIANGLYHLSKVQAYRDGWMPDHNIFDSGTALCSLEDVIITNIWQTTCTVMNTKIRDDIKFRKQFPLLSPYNPSAFKLVFKVLNQRFPIERVFINPKHQDDDDQAFIQTLNAIKSIMA